MHDDDASDGTPTLATTRTMEIVVALALIVGCVAVIYDCIRLGFGWREDGPAPGFFPFWVSVVLAGSSLVNLVQALGRSAGTSPSFVSRGAFGRVLSVLLPMLAYVLLIGGLSIGPVAIPGLGIYLASAIFIAGFMIVLGGDRPLRAVLVGVGVPLAMFVLFERWFLVPLPKGPIEAMLGF